MLAKDQIERIKLAILECVHQCRRIPDQLRVSYVFLQGMSAHEFALLHDLVIDTMLHSPQRKLLK